MHCTTTTLLIIAASSLPLAKSSPASPHTKTPASLPRMNKTICHLDCLDVGWTALVANKATEAKYDQEQSADIDVQSDRSGDVLFRRQLECSASDYHLGVEH